MAKRVAILVTFAFLFGLFPGIEAGAGEASAEKTYAGEFWNRSTLTGDWGGLRDDMAARGITFDLNLTQIEQGVANGGKDEGWKYGGRGELAIGVDTQKLGLWPGGLLSIEAEGNFNSSVNGMTGALSPVNSNQLFPIPEGDNLDLPQVAFTQFLSESVGIVLGKIDTTSGDANDFAHGKGDEQFFNLAFNFNLAAILTTPSSTLGTGIILLPTKDPKDAIIGVTVLQTNSEANVTGFSDLSWNELTFAGEGRVKTDFFGRTGHQLVGIQYSNGEFTSLGQNLRIIVEQGTLQKQKGSWNVYYNFDQYLWEPKKGSDQGFGIFGRFGVSDGNPNPVRYFYSVGVGGKGIIPCRPADRFGVGYYYVDIGNIKLTTALGARALLRNEYGFEAFYSFSLTPWMTLTPDIQVIRPAQKTVVNRTSPAFFATENVNTATVLGLRFRMIF